MIIQFHFHNSHHRNSHHRLSDHGVSDSVKSTSSRYIPDYMHCIPCLNTPCFDNCGGKDVVVIKLLITLFDNVGVCKTIQIFTKKTVDIFQLFRSVIFRILSCF